MIPGKNREPTITVRQVKGRYFAIVLVPVIIFLSQKLISDYMMPAGLEVPADIVMEGHGWLEAAGRYRFLAATWFFGSLAVLAFALLVRTLARPTTLATRLAALATLAFVLLLAAAPTIKNFGEHDGSFVYDRVGSAVFETALSRGTVSGCVKPDDHWLLGECGDQPVITVFSYVMDLVNIFAGLAVGSLIVGMILCLNKYESRDIEEEAAQLAESMREMRQQLYLSGLVLTFGMLFATSWMYWPLQMVIPAEREAYGSVLMSSALYTGTYFSLLILSFYLPVALILDSRVRRLADSAAQGRLSDDGWDISLWKETHGLKEGASDYLRAGLALSAPVLTAFAGGISPLSL